MPTTPDETAQAAAQAAAEEEAKKQATADLSPVGDVATAAADGTLGAIVEGVGDLASGALSLVGGLFEGIPDL